MYQTFSSRTGFGEFYQGDFFVVTPRNHLSAPRIGSIVSLVAQLEELAIILYCVINFDCTL